MPHVVQPPEGSPPEPTGARTVPPQNPQPASSTVSPIGRWQAYHASWQANVDFKEDGSFRAGPGGEGTWSFDGRMLRLQWSTYRPPELLELQPDGTFRGQGGFVLRKLG